jgi:hypothetical protein
VPFEALLIQSIRLQTETKHGIFSLHKTRRKEAWNGKKGKKVRGNRE